MYKGRFVILFGKWFKIVEMLGKYVVNYG